MDATRPYLERRYVQIMFEYDFQDFTYGGSGTEVIPIKYRVEGSMTLQRNINTQIRMKINRLNGNLINE